MSDKPKEVGERRRNRITEILGEKYPEVMSRAALSDILIRVPGGWSGGDLDNALHVLKMRCIIIKDDDGYQLRTAPESYNAKLLADRNGAGEKAPEPVKVSPMDSKPLMSKEEQVSVSICTQCTRVGPLIWQGLCPECETDAVGCGNCGQLPNECVCKSFPDEKQAAPVIVEPTRCQEQETICSHCQKIGPVGWQGLCKSCFYDLADATPAYDPAEVKQAMKELLDSGVQDLQLKLDVLDDLGRWLDARIKPVLKAISDDLRGKK